MPHQHQSGLPESMPVHVYLYVGVLEYNFSPFYFGTLITQFLFVPTIKEFSVSGVGDDLLCLET